MAKLSSFNGKYLDQKVIQLDVENLTQIEDLSAFQSQQIVGKAVVTNEGVEYEAFCKLVYNTSPSEGASLSLVEITGDRSLPFLASEQKLTASDGAASDRFGFSVSISADGNTAIVGSYLDDVGPNTEQGSAYVYKYNGSNWVEEQKLTALDGASNDDFGSSVSMSADGNAVIIGAFFDDDNGSSSGSAYVFRYNGSSWAQEEKLTASDGDTGDRFGWSVSISADGNTAIIGAFLDDDKGSDSGSAYVYKYNGSTWEQEQKLTASDGDTNDYFGYSVSISADGSAVIIGAYGENALQGSAYVFKYNGASWVEEQKLIASDGDAGDQLGRSASISADGSAVIIGAYFDDDNGSDSGSAYVFRYNGSSWAQEEKLTASDGDTGDRFGYSASISADGNTAIVGAYFDDDAGLSSGSAYIFKYNGFEWIEEQKLNDPNGDTNDYFGYSVSISADGSAVIIGAFLDDDKGSDSGSVYIFKYPEDMSIVNFSLNEQKLYAKVNFANATSASFYYNTLLSNKAVGFPTKVPVANAAAASESQSGVITADSQNFAGEKIFTKTFDGFTAQSSSVTLFNTSAKKIYINGHTSPVNVNLSNSIQAGQTFWVKVGSQTSGTSLEDLTATIKTSDGSIILRLFCEESVEITALKDNPVTIDDYYIDAQKDLSVPLKWSEGGLPVGDWNKAIWSPEGQLFIAAGETGESSQLQASADGINWNTAYSSSQEYEYYAQELLSPPANISSSANLGDDVKVSPDGKSLVVGAFLDNSTAANLSGAGYVYKYNSSSWKQDGTDINNPASGVSDWFGFSTAISNDGLLAVVGAPFSSTGASNGGSVYIYRYNTQTEQWDLEETLNSSLTEAGFGYSVSISSFGGSLIAIGAPYEDTNGENTGAVYLYRYDGSSWALEEKIDSPGLSSNFEFGASVSIGNTFDGDFIAVGAPGDSANGTSAGAVYIYSSDPFNPVPSWNLTGTFYGEAANDRFGGDITASDSLLIASSVWNNSAGAVYIYESDFFSGFSFVQKIQSPDQSSFPLFGSSVDISDDRTIAVGSSGLNSNQGAVYIYDYTGGTWTINQNSPLLASDGQADSRFGSSISISADSQKIIVGAYQADIGSNTDQGALYTFDYNGSSWSESAKITPPNGGSNDQFGLSAAMSQDGSRVLVGARYFSTTVGAAFSYTYETKLGWSSEKTEPSDGSQLDIFGKSCDISDDGNTVIFGAPQNDFAGSNSGQCYIYKRGGLDWQEYKLQPTLQASDYFGAKVAISSDGTVAAISAYGDDTGASNSGAVYIYRYNGSDWIQEEKLLGTIGYTVSPQYNFGSGLDFDQSGNRLAIGDAAQQIVFIYEYANGTWSLVDQISTSQSEFTAYNYGCSVSISADGLSLAVGASYIAGPSSGGGFSNSEGALFVYKYNGSSWDEQYFFFDDIRSRLGEKVSISADGNTVMASASYLHDATGFAIIVKHDGNSWYLDNTVSPNVAYKGGYFSSGISLNQDGTQAFVGASQYGGAGGQLFLFKNKDAVFEAVPVDAPLNASTGNFGIDASVSADGNVAVIGSEGGGAYIGLAFIYRYNGSSWELEQEIQPSDGANGDYFGRYVSISADGNAIIIGAHLDDDNGSSSGSAYIFRYDGSTWAQEQKLTASDGAASDYFGFSVSISADGNAAIVGAYADDDLGSTSGSAYIFRYDGSTWTQEQKLTASDGAGNDQFGRSVAISADGNSAIVGAIADDDKGSSSGSAYIFRYDGSTWAQEQKLTASDGEANDQLGWAVSMSADGNAVVVGAYTDSVGSNGNQGSAYIFKYNGSIWNQEQKLIASDGATSDFFGYSVAISADGNAAIVGATGDDDKGSSAGAAYIFKYNGSTWTEEKIDFPGAEEFNGIGRAVSISEDLNTIVAGTLDNRFFVRKKLQTSSREIFSNVCYSPDLGMFVAISKYGKGIKISYDGESWSEPSGLTLPGTVFKWKAISWAPELGLFVVLSDSGPFFSITSSDGVNWTFNDGSYAVPHSWQDVQWSPEINRFLGLALNTPNNKSPMIASSDGIVWSSYGGGIKEDWKQSAWSPSLGYFVAIEESNNSRKSRIITWPSNAGFYTSIEPSSANTLSGIVPTSIIWNDTLKNFIATSSSGGSDIFYSKDAISWSRYKTSHNIVANSITYSPELDRYVIVGLAGGAGSIHSKR